MLGMMSMGKIRILLAENYPFVSREIMRLLSSDPDLEVVGEVGDGEAAVATAGQLCPDVVVMDVSLPRMNGFAASRQIGHRLPRTGVVLLVEDGNLDYLRAALDHGARACIARRGAGRQLVHAVKMVFGGLHQEETPIT